MRKFDLLKALSNLKVETGSLVCMGCGHEHGCSTHGCAILRAAIRVIRSAEIVPADESRLFELAQADKEGRIVVLPCKVGGTACLITDAGVHELEITEFFGDKHGVILHGKSKTFVTSIFERNIGKSVFLTREEAEKALDERRAADG